MGVEKGWKELEKVGEARKKRKRVRKRRRRRG